MTMDMRDGLLGGTFVSRSSLDEVRTYYNTAGANWGDCYRSTGDETPDPAVLRLRVVLQMVDRYCLDNFFDAGCADAPVMVELLRRGKSVAGVDFSEVLVARGKERLEQAGFDPGLCAVGDVTRLHAPDERYDAVLCLGVLPHIERMDSAIRELVRITRPGGVLILSFRNDLFDLFTFNRFTVEFYADRFFPLVPFTEGERDRAMQGVKSLLAFPEKPAVDNPQMPPREFDRLTRINHNPLTIGEDMARFGVTHILNGYYKFHPVPPLLQDRFPDFAKIGARMDKTLSFSWVGMFMCSTFVAAFRKGDCSGRSQGEEERR